MSQSYKQRQKALVKQLEYQAAEDGSNTSHATVVAMRDNYVSTVETCLTSVAFIPSSIYQAVFEPVIAELQHIDPAHHYYADHSLHMTIKNIRKIANPKSYTQDNINTAKRVLADVIPQHRPIEISLEHVVCFKTSVCVIGYSDKGLGELVTHLDDALASAGLKDDKNYASSDIYFLNSTFCRFVHPPSLRLRKYLSSIKDQSQSTLILKNIHLVESDAVCSDVSLKVHGEYMLARH